MAISRKVEVYFQMAHEEMSQNFQFLKKANKITTILLMIKKLVKCHTKLEQAQGFKANFKLPLIKMI